MRVGNAPKIAGRRDQIYRKKILAERKKVRYGHTGTYEMRRQEYKVNGICVAESREY